MGAWADLATFRARARAPARLGTRIYAAVPLADWERLRDTWPARNTAARRPRRRVAAHRRAQGLRRRLARLAHRGVSRAVHDAPEGPRAARQHARGSLRLDLRRRQGRAARDGARHRRPGQRQLLDIYERVARENGPRDRRFRIEHAQHLAAADIPRFAALGVIASMQPYHAIDDGRWAEKVDRRQRIKTTYAFRSLLDAGARLAFGSDWFVAPPTPLEGIYAAVTRRTLDDKQPGRLGAGAEDHGRGGAARLHQRRGVRVVRGDAERRAGGGTARRLRDARPRTCSRSLLKRFARPGSS